MEEFFKGLIERARYYERFESFRDAQITGNIQNADTPDLDLNLKSPVSNY